MDLGWIFEQIQTRWGSIMSDPATYVFVGLVGAFIAFVAQEWRFGAVRDRLEHFKEQNEDLKKRAGTGDAPEKIWPKAKFRDYSNDTDIPARMRLNQWALLLRGYEPACDLEADPMDMPPGVYRAFKALKEASLAGKLKTVSGNAYRASEVDRDELRRYFKSEGKQPLWLFPSMGRLAKFWRF